MFFLQCNYSPDNLLQLYRGGLVVFKMADAKLYVIMSYEDVQTHSTTFKSL